jgi:hypothetical protein
MHFIHKIDILFIFIVFKFSFFLFNALRYLFNCWLIINDIHFLPLWLLMRFEYAGVMLLYIRNWQFLIWVWSLYLSFQWLNLWFQLIYLPIIVTHLLQPWTQLLYLLISSTKFILQWFDSNRLPNYQIYCLLFFILIYLCIRN